MSFKAFYFEDKSFEFRSESTTGREPDSQLIFHLALKSMHRHLPRQMAFARRSDTALAQIYPFSERDSSTCQS